MARALLQANRLSLQEVQALHQKSLADKTPFIDLLLQESRIDSPALAQFCAETFSLPLLELSAFDFQFAPDNLIDAKLMQSQRVIALARRGSRLTVALSDPTNNQVLDRIKFQTELMVKPVIVEHRRLLQCLEKLGQSAGQSLNRLIGDELEHADFVTDASDADAAAADAAADIEDAPVVRFLQKLLIDAINMGASDLHFEPFEKFYRICFRIDGVQRKIAQPPLAIKEKLA